MTQEIDIDYTPNEKQSIFHQSPASEVIYGGAKGGGKSCALVMDAFAYGLQFAGARIYLFRETYDDLEANLIEEMRTKIPKDLYSYNEGKHVATLHNGTRILFRYVTNLDDAKKYQGRSIDYIGVDELTKHDEPTIQELLSCVRSPKGYPAVFKATCNPGGIGHEWVKRTYIDATDYGEKIAINEKSGNRISFIPATVYDNTILMENDPAYVRRLENLPEDEKKAYLYGSWDIFQGQYFSNFDRNTHVIDPIEIPSHWKRFRSIDHGFKDHTAWYWHAQDTEGRIYTYRELYVNETLASDIAAEVVRLSEGEDIEYSVGSPDMWQKRGGLGSKTPEGLMIGKTIADIYRENGVPIIQADNRRIIGWQRMAEYLKVEEADQEPNWYIFKNCENLVRTLPYLVRDDKKIEDIADNQEDHPAESCRYFFMSRPAKSKAPKKDENEIQRHKRKLAKKSIQRRQRMGL